MYRGGPLARALRGEGVKDALITARLDDRWTFLRCNAAPLQGTDGEIAGAVVLVQDVTSEQTAHLQQEDLRHRLLVTLNHEFRTPLTKLLGHAELLREDADALPPPCQHSVGVVWRSAEELAGLMRTISEILDLEAHAKLTRSHTDVTRLVREVADDFNARHPGVRLIREAPASLRARLDPAKTRHALEELLENAATYSPPDSEVVLRLSADSTTVKIAVCGTGTGIAARERERLQQPFERGDHPQQPVNSKGLGLAIARTVAAVHGGLLTLATNEPRGLLATLALPRE